MLTSMYDCRKLKEDAVPTVAFADFARTNDNQGTLQYYLTAAFGQVYAQQNVMLPFTGRLAAALICLSRFLIRLGMTNKITTVSGSNKRAH